MPVEKASTVHTTLQSSTAATTAHDLLQTLAASTAQTATIQNSQINNTKTTFQTDMAANATASCGTAGGGFLVYWTFTNATAFGEGTLAAPSSLGIQNSTGTGVDIAIPLKNQTSISGVIGGLTGETIVFTGNSSGTLTGAQTFEDTGDLTITVVCRAGSTAGTTP